MLDPLTARVRVISAYLANLLLHGAPKVSGDDRSDLLWILDGVGGFQIGPVLVRRALRAAGSTMATRYFRWQYGLPGEIWTDLMWYRRNRVVAVRFARMLLAHRRAHPECRMNLLALSGGTGIAAYALEALRGREVLDTLVLACSALSPTYNLAPALRCVKRCYALVSEGDNAVLGFWTRVFGTVDRCHSPAGGCVGFRMPAGISAEDAALYQRMREIRWTPALRGLGQNSGHTGWLAHRFLQEHLLPLLAGTPLLETHEIPLFTPTQAAVHEPGPAG